MGRVTVDWVVPVHRVCRVNHDRVVAASERVHGPRYGEGERHVARRLGDRGVNKGGPERSDRGTRGTVDSVELSNKSRARAPVLREREREPNDIVATGTAGRVGLREIEGHGVVVTRREHELGMRVCRSQEKDCEALRGQQQTALRAQLDAARPDQTRPDTALPRICQLHTPANQAYHTYDGCKRAGVVKDGLRRKAGRALTRRGARDSRCHACRRTRARSHTWGARGLDSSKPHAPVGRHGSPAPRAITAHETADNESLARRRDAVRSSTSNGGAVPVDAGSRRHDERVVESSDRRVNAARERRARERQRHV